MGRAGANGLCASAAQDLNFGGGLDGPFGIVGWVCAVTHAQESAQAVAACGIGIGVVGASSAAPPVEVDGCYCCAGEADQGECDADADEDLFTNAQTLACGCRKGRETER